MVTGLRARRRRPRCEHCRQRRRKVSKKARAGQGLGRAKQRALRKSARRRLRARVSARLPPQRPLRSRERRRLAVVYASSTGSTLAHARRRAPVAWAGKTPLSTSCVLAVGPPRRAAVAPPVPRNAASRELPARHANQTRRHSAKPAHICAAAGSCACSRVLTTSSGVTTSAEIADAANAPTMRGPSSSGTAAAAELAAELLMTEAERPK
eukprot:291789-Chlamydomonas_euryale.AAC.3